MRYKVLITKSAKLDIKDKKKYILDRFKYRKLGDDFSKKIRKIAGTLEVLPEAYQQTGFQYRGYEIYLKSSNTYLLFYVVDNNRNVVTILRVLQDGMNWQFIIKNWLKKVNRTN